MFVKIFAFIQKRAVSLQPYEAKGINNGTGLLDTGSPQFPAQH